MKILKKFLAFIVGAVLFFLLLAFSLNMVFKGVIQKQVIGGVAKTTIVSEYLDKSDIENKDEIKKLLDSKDSLKVVNNVVNEYMEYLVDNNHKVSKTTLNSIIDFCVKHREEINKISNDNVSESEIKSQETYNNLEQSINDGFKEIGTEIGDTPREILKTYSSITSNNFQVVLIIAIIICIILLIIINESLFKWISRFGSSLLTCGIIICLLYIGANMLVSKIIEKLDFEISIKLEEMLVIGIIEIVVGILLIVLKVVLTKMKNNKFVNSTVAKVHPTPTQPTSSQSIPTPTQPTSSQSIPTSTQPTLSSSVESTSNNIE